ncbi:MAG: type II secretion system protein [Patescibacteria group bacterium]
MSKTGFTLIEVLVVTTISVILLGVVLSFYSYFLIFNTLDAARQEVLQNIRLAQTLAQTGSADNNYGVYFGSTTYTVYQGSSYVSRVPNQDQVFSLADDVQATGLTEINFTKKTGLPSVNGTLILTNAKSLKSAQININQLGLIY